MKSMKPDTVVLRSAQIAAPGQRRGQQGFTLVELLVSAAIFLVVGATAFSLVRQNQPYFNQQQSMAALNIGIRNAVAQLQVDLSNAGAGYYPGINIPDFPLGVVLINNKPASSCYNSSTHVYSSSCFDKLNIIYASPDITTADPVNLSGPFSTTATTFTVTVPAGKTAAQIAGMFKSGDQVLFLKNDGSQYTTTVLTADSTVVGAVVQMAHNATNADGTNSSSNDPLSISTDTVSSNTKLGTSFGSSDWVLKLSPITYQVDSTDSTNPKLTRTRNGVTDVVAEQIIGFKLGASLWNTGTGTDNSTYTYDASTYGYNYTLVRSVQVSMIGRTTPVTDPTFKYRNEFDQGPYLIQGATVVMSPRNLSMKDVGG
jgi:prepilin-type N-terminal cleavage/methylation domain-containing protein